MKYYINHCEIFKTWSTWEVEADSFDEAVQKLNRAAKDDIDLANTMTDMINNDTMGEIEDYPAKTSNDYTPYVLSDLIQKEPITKGEVTMLYILLHKNQMGTFVEMVTQSRTNAIKKLIQLYNDTLQKTPDNKISSFDMLNNESFYAEIVYSEDETEWWEVVSYDKDKVK